MFFAVDKIVEFTRGLFNLTSQTQKLNTAFTQLLGSEEKALDLLSQIDDFAARTPFNRLQVAESAQRLLAFGFAAEQVIPSLNAIGEAVSSV